MQLRTGPAAGGGSSLELKGLARQSICLSIVRYAATLSRFEPDSLSRCRSFIIIIEDREGEGEGEGGREGRRFPTISLGASDYDLKSRIKGKIPAIGRDRHTDRMLFLAHRKGGTVEISSGNIARWRHPRRIIIYLN